MLFRSCLTELSLLRAFRATPRPKEAAAIRWITDRLRAPAASTAVAPKPLAKARLPWWKSVFSPAYAPMASLAAAMVLLVVAGGLYLVQNQRPSLHRGAGAGPHVFRSGQVNATEPVGDLERPPAELRWQPFAGAASYEVKIMEVEDRKAHV